MPSFILLRSVIYCRDYAQLESFSFSFLCSAFPQIYCCASNWWERERERDSRQLSSLKCVPHLCCNMEKLGALSPLLTTAELSLTLSGSTPSEQQARPDDTAQAAKRSRRPQMRQKRREQQHSTQKHSI